jgi:hypothetical protein
LHNSRIYIDYVIDSSYCVNDFDEELTVLNWTDEFPDVDAVIVTLIVDYNKVIGTLKERLKCPVITIQDMILDMQLDMLLKSLEM